MKAKRGKCLALVAVLAMVVCAFAIALPAEDSDAADTASAAGFTKLTGNNAVIEKGKSYYIAGDVTVATCDSTDTEKSTVVLVGKDAKLTLTATVTTDSLTIYLAADGDATTAPKEYYTGLSYAGAQGKTYYAGVDADSNRYLKSDAEAKGVGVVQTYATDDIRSYPAGSVCNFEIINAQTVKVKNGSATVSTKKTADATDTIAKISLEKIVSTDGVLVQCGPNGAMNGVSGAYTGSITMVKGVATSAQFTIGNDAVLNAYAEGDVGSNTGISAEANSSTTYVYGSVANGTASDSVTLVNANVAKLTLGSANNAPVIGAEKATTGAVTATGITSVNSGTLRLVSGGFVSGTFVIGTAGTPAVAANLDVGVNAELNLTGDVTVNESSVMNVYGKLTGSATVMGDGTFNAYNGAVVGQEITVETAKFNISGAMQEAVINGNVNSNVTFSQFQIVRVTEDITIAEGVEVTVKGKLIVEKDASVTIAKKAKLVVGSDSNNTSEVEILGNMEIQGGGLFKVVGGKTVTIFGNVDVEGSGIISDEATTEGFVVGDAETILKSGALVTVNENAFIEAGAGLTVSNGAKIVVEGTFSGTGVNNAGEIVVDGKVRGNVTINMKGSDAVVDLKSIKLIGGGDTSFSISDYGLEFTDKTKVGDGAENSLGIKDGNGLAGLKVVEKVTSYIDENGDVKYSNKMDISGSLEGIAEGGDHGMTTVTVIANTGAVVSETLTIGEYVTFVNSGKLLVSGQMNQVETNSVFKNEPSSHNLAGDAIIDVTGQIKTITDLAAERGVINAAMYRAEENGKTYNFYTTLKLAIDSGNKDIKILGTITVEEDISVPAGVTVSGTEAELNIGTEKKRDVTVTVDDGAKLKGINPVNVYGTLVFAVDKTGNKNNTIISDVMTTEGASSKYTNLYKALAEAVSGETVTVTGNDVKITQDVTVGEGVILLIPAGKFVTVGDNVTVTVIGTMDAWEKLKAETKFAEKASGDAGAKASAIKVSGIFKSNAEVKYDYYVIAGAYFTVTTTSATYNFATPVEYAASVSKDVQNGKIEIYGANTVGDVAFAGTATQPVVVTIFGTLKAGTVDLELASFGTPAGMGCFSGTVGSDVGAVAFAHAQNFTVRSLMSGETEVVKLSSTGVVCGEEKKTLSVTISAGTITVDTDGFKVAKMSVADVAKLLVTKDAIADVNDLTVNGQADVTDGGKIKTMNLAVMGTFTVGQADANKGIKAGTVEAKYVFIGIAKSAVIKTTGAAAAFNADAVTGLEVVYLAAGSSVTEDLVKEMKKTVYSVDGSEYLTVYAVDGKQPAINDLVKPELAGKEITGWSYVKNGETKVVENEKVGAVSAVSAVINTKVYNVKITADYGFADVFIDGAKVASIVGGMTVYVGGDDCVKLAAGTHTVEWKLKNNYAGDITGTFDGKQISDKKFTIGSDMKFSGVSYNLVLTGAIEQPQVQPSTDNGGDDGSGITDILLIVLVVLIAVMAIMVALRLMRS